MENIIEELKVIGLIEKLEHILGGDVPASVGCMRMLPRNSCGQATGCLIT